MYHSKLDNLRRFSAIVLSQTHRTGSVACWPGGSWVSARAHFFLPFWWFDPWVGQPGQASITHPLSQFKPSHKLKPAHSSADQPSFLTHPARLFKASFLKWNQIGHMPNYCTHQWKFRQIPTCQYKKPVEHSNLTIFSFYYLNINVRNQLIREKTSVTCLKGSDLFRQEVANSWSESIGKHFCESQKNSSPTVASGLVLTGSGKEGSSTSQSTVSWLAKTNYKKT